MYDGMQNASKISLVVIRIELDDTLGLQNTDLFDYKCKLREVLQFHLVDVELKPKSFAAEAHLANQRNKKLFESSDIIACGEEGYKSFIGQRTFHNISLETYKFNVNGKTDTCRSS
jgi:hypothetical protein